MNGRKYPHEYLRNINKIYLAKRGNINILPLHMWMYVHTYIHTHIFHLSPVYIL